MSAVGDDRGPHLSIGEVLALLLEEFPDVTISKIRFLESQGLIDPERTPSGYRKFYDDDVELLRCILHEQRENFLPLKVIKDRLDTGEIDPTNENTRPRGIRNVELDDSGDVERGQFPPAAAAPASPAATGGTGDAGQRHPSAGKPAAAHDQMAGPDAGPPSAPAHPPGSGNGGSVPPATPAPQAPAADAAASTPLTVAAQTGTDAAAFFAARPTDVAMDAAELAAASGLTTEQIEQLTSYGVIQGKGNRVLTYDGDALAICQIAGPLLEIGIEPRHLRGWRVAADREVGLFEQLVQPLLRQRNPTSRQQAVDRLVELEAAGGQLRHAMMRAALRALDDGSR
jgi:DNA-binding transcriptional MerR regulator